MTMPTKEEMARNLAATQIASRYKFKMEKTKNRNWIDVTAKMVKEVIPEQKQTQNEPVRLRPAKKRDRSSSSEAERKVRRTVNAAVEIATERSRVERKSRSRTRHRK